MYSIHQLLLEQLYHTANNIIIIVLIITIISAIDDYIHNIIIYIFYTCILFANPVIIYIVETFAQLANTAHNTSRTQVQCRRAHRRIPLLTISTPTYTYIYVHTMSIRLNTHLLAIVRSGQPKST